jgi:hypothetical protein
MITKRTSLLVCIALLGVGTSAYAQGPRPQIGVQLDPSPLPELLTKHLGLQPDQGIRIQNVAIGSPADKIGLERDDIIIRFQGRDVTDVDEFVNAIREEGVGAEVTLEIIHLGQRQTLEFELTPIESNPEWKYPPEPEIVTSWRPGKFFRVGPNGQNWMEVPFDKVPDINVDVKKFFQERYMYHHTTDGEDYTVTIEGDPSDEDTQVTVRAEDKEYVATVGEPEKLPEKYRAAAKDAIRSASKSSKQRIRIGKVPLPEPPDPDLYRQYFKDLAVPMPNLDQWSEKRDRMLEKLEEQMERLQQRMEQLEEHFREPSGGATERENGPNGNGDLDPTGGTAGAQPKAGQAV